MAVRITNEIHEGEYKGQPYREHERYVSGERSHASVWDDKIYLEIMGIPEIPMTWDIVRDLREVLDAAIDLRNR